MCQIRFSEACEREGHPCGDRYYEDDCDRSPSPVAFPPQAFRGYRDTRHRGEDQYRHACGEDVFRYVECRQQKAYGEHGYPDHGPCPEDGGGLYVQTFAHSIPPASQNITTAMAKNTTDIYLFRDFALTLADI